MPPENARENKFKGPYNRVRHDFKKQGQGILLSKCIENYRTNIRNKYIRLIFFQAISFTAIFVSYAKYPVEKKVELKGINRILLGGQIHYATMPLRNQNHSCYAYEILHMNIPSITI